MPEPLKVYVPTVIDHFESFRKKLRALDGELDDGTKQEMRQILDQVYAENSVLISKDDYEKDSTALTLTYLFKTPVNQERAVNYRYKFLAQSFQLHRPIHIIPEFHLQ